MEEEAREMESPEEVMASTTSNGELPPPPMMIVKGKRTKRQRVVAATDATTSSAESKNLQGGEYSTEEEEEEMANCLILLAQGPALQHPAAGEKFSSRRFTEAATTTAGRAGFYVYECKTCNKCFPSFQALGGHRASHKRPKITEEGSAVIDEDSLKISMNSFMKPSAIGSNSSKTRVHECSICGSEFFSGQALGGHMRRHRPVVVAPEGKKERNFLSLDLNLPAPAEEDLRGSPSVGLTLSLAGKRPVIFSPGTTLVDCHY